MVDDSAGSRERSPSVARPAALDANETRKPFHERPFFERHWRALIAVAGGGFAALATPPTDLYPSMLVGVCLLALAVRDAPTFWRGFGVGLVWSAAGQLVVMRFVPSTIMLFTDLGVALALLAHVLLSLAQSLHWAIGMGLTALLRQRLRAPLELALGAGTLCALSIPSVFVWSPAGLLSPWPVLLQSAELVGERGVSVLLAIIAALVVRAWLDKKGAVATWWRAAAAAGALVGIMLAHGAWRMRAYSDEGLSTARLALIHAAVDPKDRWKRSNWPSILSQLKNQTATAETTGVDLSVWPEAAYPYHLPHDSLQAPRSTRQIIGGAVRGPILFGFIAAAPARRDDDGSVIHDSYNSATVVMPDGAMQPSYDKMELLWFGETVPLARQLPWLRRLFQRSGGLIPGEAVRALSLARDDGEALRMGVFNCYEDTLPSYGRELFAATQPNLLVNVTNDAWFVGSQEPWLHQRLAAMRSIELRRDMVRAVNLGVSSWIDAGGRMRRSRHDAEPGFLLVAPALRNEPPTPYARFGDWPVIALLSLSIGGLWWRQRKIS